MSQVCFFISSAKGGGLHVGLMRSGWIVGIVFTLVLKDSVPPNSTDRGVMEESTISYETTFSPGVGERVYLPFVGFKAMYRGRTKEDAPPVNLANIRRFSLMVRR